MTPVKRAKKERLEETQDTANQPDPGFVHSAPNDEEVLQDDSHEDKNENKKQRARDTQSLSHEPDMKPETVSPTTGEIDLTKNLSPNSEIEITAIQTVQKPTRQKRDNVDSTAPIASIEIPSNKSDGQPHLPAIPPLDQPEEENANQEDLDDTPERDLWDVPSYHGSSPSEGPDGNEVGDPTDTTEAHPAPQGETQTQTQTQTQTPKRRRRRRRYANVQPTRRSRRLRGEPPEFLGLEPVRRKRRARK